MANWFKETGWFEKSPTFGSARTCDQIRRFIARPIRQTALEGFYQACERLVTKLTLNGDLLTIIPLSSPRVSRTRHLDLQGRSFLHDYDQDNDPDFSILERILTAPMLVTHWINMQYNLSVTDNFKFGCGNKVLHNAVGGNIGVFEGNGGDLRIGLSMQSLNDGQKWMHTPVKLAVYVAAPKAAIEDIAAKHDIVRQLIDNGWLYFFQWEGDKIQRFYQQQWQTPEQQKKEQKEQA